ncbi:DUF418 domain-containing protein [Metabacillus niabensis]|uniref:DUF418 domain-containing protein n=1 Tax=Metabacillus niabensis TaxID=324854 RepID=A0ABT9Z895_9BACI|nr:DUF418 domain-containing protein [Metabacillus niabensis]MDQ0228051.1 uncharacterized protein [Metabacillus niabensis]
MNTNRIHTIDGLRGLSLLGILMANMLIFQYGIWGKDEIHLYSLNQMDNIAYYLLKIFVEGSFMPIFTFLFGYSMIMMANSIKKKGGKVKRTFFRRFFFLAFIGFLHSEFLWEGDILTFYGIMGILLLIFVNRKPKTLLIWGLSLLVLSSLFGYGLSTYETDEEKKTTEEYVLKTIDIYGEGSYFEIKEHRNNEMPIDIPDFLFIFGVFLVPLFSLALFLIGMYCAKTGWFVTPKEDKKKYLTISAILLPIGLICKSMLYVIPENPWSGAINMLGGNLLSLGYICAFALMYISGKQSMVVKMFESVGKLSFSNYILQTIICTTIFYGYGFGFFGKLGVLIGIFLSLIIYMLQMVGSYVYLKKFKMGPLEKLLRIFTYFSWKGTQKVKNKDVTVNA